MVKKALSSQTCGTEVHYFEGKLPYDRIFAATTDKRVSFRVKGFLLSTRSLGGAEGNRDSPCGKESDYRIPAEAHPNPAAERLSVTVGPKDVTV